jgi:hypothetical protein
MEIKASERREQISVYLDRDLIAEVRRISREKGVRVQDVIRALVADGVKRVD